MGSPRAFSFALGSLVVASACAAFAACTGEDPDIIVTTNPPDAATPDAPAADTAAADAAPDVPPCDPTKPFGPLVAVKSLNTAEEERNASFSSDELTVYLIRGSADAAAPNRALYAATRATRDDDFGAPILVSGLSEIILADNASVTDDGLKLYVQGQRLDEAGAPLQPDLFRAERPSKMTSFGALTEIAELNTPALDGDPFITPDGTTLYFASSRTGTNRVYRADWNGTKFVGPVPLTELDDAGGAAQPVVSADGLTLFFSSQRVPTLGGFDIWVATRANALGAFGDLVHLDALSSPSTDVALWYSPDECRLYVGADRDGGAGGRDVYLATRPR